MVSKLNHSISLLLVGFLFVPAAVADTVVVGYVSYDVTSPGNAQIDITNQSGANDSSFPDTTFPVATSVSLANLSLDISFTSGPDEIFDSSYFTLSPDGLSFSGKALPTDTGQPNGLFGAQQAVLTGNFDTTSFLLNDGSTVTVDPFFSAVITDPAGLSDQDFALITASTVPESNTCILLGVGLLGLFAIRRRLPVAPASSSSFPNRSLIGPGIAFVALLALGSLPALAADYNIKLNTYTTPAAGTTGSTSVTLTGSGFPSGSIEPSAVELTFSPSCGAVGSTTPPGSITPLYGSSDRIQFLVPSFLVPAGQQTSTYYVSISGMTTSGTTFASDTCSEISVTKGTTPSLGTLAITSPYANENVPSPLTVTGTCQANSTITFSGGIIGTSTICTPSGAFATQLSLSGQPGATQFTATQQPQSGDPSSVSLQVNYSGTGALKSALHGIIAMGSTMFNVRGGSPTNLTDYSTLISNGYTGVVDAVVINETWADVEPSYHLYNKRNIEDALTAIRNYNAANPGTPWAARLRIFAGQNVPSWVLNDFGSVNIGNKNLKYDQTISQFWTQGYSQAFNDLQEYLASQYDSEPLIHEVSMTNCSSSTDEAMALAEYGDSIANLLNAGYTDADYEACLTPGGPGGWDYSGWKTTRIDFPFNPFRSIDGTLGTRGQVTQSPSITEGLMRTFRQNLGMQATLHNHGLGANSTGTNGIDPSPNLLPIYQYMQLLGPTIELQQSGPTDTNLAGSIPQAVNYGATAVEIWNECMVAASVSSPCTATTPTITITPGVIQEWGSMLKANSAP